ncbi:glycoprotein endo-alpha-1,2-mannosidase-like protein [Drosophila busckii]|uniref:glycoprotein endo-alpha-1,2-mannosidase-like protein n=1 Tax=Drosophila busckii TaxID=30019 RepID=UPI0014331CDA|nr:glycoprotein endo-alpha-1,2-mannosidase-like protein [Drosophila busckii]
MLLKKYVKTRRKFKILLLVAIVALIIITSAILLGATGPSSAVERLLDERFIARAYQPQSEQQQQQPREQAVGLLQSRRENGVIVPEKYDEQKIKSRIMQSRLQQLKQQQQRDNEAEQTRTTLDTVATAVHIFYTAPVQWYKSKKSPLPAPEHPNEVSLPLTTSKPVKVLNTIFYPALGLYKPSAKLLAEHFENIRSCGIGVLILSFARPSDPALLQQILELAPQHNLSVTFELSVTAGNRSVELVRQQLHDISAYVQQPGFYRVWSQSHKALMPVLYISNAYKLSESLGRQLCRARENEKHKENAVGLRQLLDAFFIGHIRLKSHADVMRRLCFDGFYSKLPSNGAVFASTWKNWSYLKSFALSYKMLFVPTVGPGYAERNKFPRHGDIQRHRSNGRYYGVAWRTAILNHVGFINIASYNNWPDGSQIEEVVPRAGFLDYNPGSKTKYLDLTAHWVGNFLKTRQEAAAAVAPQNCYELLNNTIC